MADKETKTAVSNNDGENDAEELVVGGDKHLTLSSSRWPLFDNDGGEVWKSLYQEISRKLDQHLL